MFIGSEFFYRTLKSPTCRKRWWSGPSITISIVYLFSVIVVRMYSGILHLKTQLSIVHDIGMPGIFTNKH